MDEDDVAPAMDDDQEQDVMKHPRKQQKVSLDDDGESGEDTAIPSRNRVGVYSDEEDESESEDEEMTEADKQFIVDDAEDEGEGSDTGGHQKRRKRKRKKKRAVSDSESDLDEDDLDLLEQNTGRKTFKRLRRKVDEDEDTAAKIFSDDEEDYNRSGDRERDLYDDDDLDDFIIDDEEGEGTEIDRAEKLAQRRKEKASLGQNLARNIGITDEQWRDVQFLFDYENDYGWALAPRADLDLADIEENDDDMMLARDKEVKLADVYEPTEIAEKLLTEKDEEIRVRDLPERMQLRGDIPPGETEELESEAKWIGRHFFERRNIRNMPLSREHPLIESIFRVLNFMRGENPQGERQFFEVPFIYQHRKDYIAGQLALADLWMIYDLDQQYLALESKKRSVQGLLGDVAALSEEATKDEYMKEVVAAASSLQEVTDVLQCIQLKYGEELARAEHSRKQVFKRSRRKTPYEVARKAGIGEFVKAFDCLISHVAKSSKNAIQGPEPHETPLEAAKKFVGGQFSTPEEVLSAARMMLVAEIAADPTFRAFVRRVYSSDSSVTVTPTKKGNVEIDPAHPYYPFKYLSDKYVFDFRDGQFLQILAAEEEGLITTEITIAAESEFFKDIHEKVTAPETNEYVKEWNDERRRAIEQACREILFPQIVKGQKEQLGLAAANFVADACRKSLEKRLNMAGYKRSGDDTDLDDWPMKVLAISWGDGEQQPAFSAMVKETGELLQWNRYERLRGMDPRGPDAESLIGTITRHKPDVIAIAGFKPNTKTVLYRALEEILQTAVAEGRLAKGIRIVFVEDDAARIYMNSRVGMREMPDSSFPPLVRYCVSLARRVQDPVTEFATLWNHQDDIMHLRLHPLQHLIPQDKLKSALEKAFVNVVNACGVDINFAAQHPHVAGTLQFVSGLGPRKAQAFITKIVRSGGKIDARSQLVKKGLCGKHVFMNCSSFIRIRSRHFADRYANLDVLDDTRIHPEDYDLARKMAADALDYDDATVEEEENPSMHVAELMESDDIEKLAHLALDDFAEELERRTNEKKKMVLDDIMQELMAPYAERRESFRAASESEIFTMLTNETDESLAEDSIHSVQIVRVSDRILKCRLQSGLDGLIHIRNVPLDRYRAESLQEAFREDTLVQAKVLRVEKDKMTVELSLRDVDPRRCNGAVPVDPRFDRHREEDYLAAQRNVQVRKSKNKQARIIQHPYFKQLDYRSVQQYLADKAVGSIVIRPSTQGNDHFAITWKVEEGVCQHIDVKELHKDNEWALGKTLVVADEKYHEIDQIVAEYIEPTRRRVQSLMAHPKFQKKDTQAMYKHVEEQCNSTRRSAYGFVLAMDKPGDFYLVYKHPQSRPFKDLVRVDHKGFWFRKKRFERVDDLLGYFKQDEARRAQSAQSRTRPPQPQPGQYPVGAGRAPPVGAGYPPHVPVPGGYGGSSYPART
ncbi:SH2 domain-containing protein [Gaertneriomyces semiglobifer]|nr:SH2 domain-containing protein [Gaertneriomyces semiglobifer]